MRLCLNCLAVKTTLEYLASAFMPFVIISRETRTDTLKKGGRNRAAALDNDVKMRGHHTICENLETADFLSKPQALQEKRMIAALVENACPANATICDVVIPG